MIIPIWQKIGQSTHQIASMCGKLRNEKATHTGTLDPMASGVVIILTGEDRFKKGAQTAWNKTYEFSILWGVSTDTGDLLGMIKKVAPQIPSSEKIARIVTDFPRTYDQLQPAFSARRYNGLSSFDWARTGVELPQKKRAITIDSLTTDFFEVKSLSQIVKQQTENIHKIHGDFRQTEVLNNWSQLLQENDQSYLISHHTAVVSTGTYIRQLTQDIALLVGVPATTAHITRIKNGQFQKKDCSEYTLS
jgi:tRNA pseudouridine55 synthase